MPVIEHWAWAGRSFLVEGNFRREIRGRNRNATLRRIMVRDDFAYSRTHNGPVVQSVFRWPCSEEEAKDIHQWQDRLAARQAAKEASDGLREL